MELPDCMHILANLKMVLISTCDFIVSFGPFPIYWNSAVYLEVIIRKLEHKDSIELLPDRNSFYKNAIAFEFCLGITLISLGSQAPNQ